MLPYRRVLCTPYNHAPCHFMQSHIRTVHAYLAVTCHLHFRQNDLDLLRATAVTRGWNGYRNKSHHRKSVDPGEENSLASHAGDSNPLPFDHDSGALTTDLSPLPNNYEKLSFLIPLWGHFKVYPKEHGPPPLPNLKSQYEQCVQILQCIFKRTLFHVASVLLSKALR